MSARRIDRSNWPLIIIDDANWPVGRLYRKLHVCIIMRKFRCPNFGKNLTRLNAIRVNDFTLSMKKGTSAYAGPHYQKLYGRVTRVWSNRRGQPKRSAMQEPRPGRSPFVIRFTSPSGKYASILFYAYTNIVTICIGCGWLFAGGVAKNSQIRLLGSSITWKKYSPQARK